VLPLAARRVFCRVLPQAYQTGLILRGDRRVLPQGVAYQPRVCAQHAARLGVKNRLMPRELLRICQCQSISFSWFATWIEVSWYYSRHWVSILGRPLSVRYKFANFLMCRTGTELHLSCNDKLAGESHKS
jgi:hypothetical protein